MRGIAICPRRQPYVALILSNNKGACGPRTEMKDQGRKVIKKGMLRYQAKKTGRDGKMRGIFKNVIALILAVSTLVSLFPVQAISLPEGGRKDGRKVNPEELFSVITMDTPPVNLQPTVTELQDDNNSLSGERIPEASAAISTFTNRTPNFFARKIMNNIDVIEFHPVLQEMFKDALLSAENANKDMALQVKEIMCKDIQQVTSEEMDCISNFFSVSSEYLSARQEHMVSLQDALVEYRQLETAGVSQTEIEAAAQTGVTPELLINESVHQRSYGVQTRAANDPFSEVQMQKEKLLSAPYMPTDNVNERVDLASGGLEYNVTDVVLPGAGGLDLTIGRTYNSLEANYYMILASLVQKSYYFRSVYGSYNYKELKLYRNEDGTFSYRDEYTASTKNIRYDSDVVNGINSVRNRIYETDTRFYADSYNFNYVFNSSASWKVAVGIDDIQVKQETTPQTVNEYLWDLGAGWSFNFSCIKLDQAFGGTGKKQVCLSDGRQFAMEPNATNGLGEYFYEDVKCEAITGNMNGQALGYLVVYGDGKKEYFSTKGFVLRTEDRFGNAINYEYVAPEDDERREITITDTLGQITRIYNVTNVDGFYKIVELPDEKKITYTLKENAARKIPYIWQLGVDYHEYNLAEVVDMDGQKTVYSYTDREAPYDAITRLKGPTKAGLYECDPYNNFDTPFRYPNQYDLTYYRSNYYANLTQVTYPSGVQTCYSYNKRWNNWTEIGTKIDFAIAGRYTLQNGQRIDEKQYYYSNQYRNKDGELTTDMYNWDGYSHTGGLYEGERRGQTNDYFSTTTEVDPIRNTRTRYVFNLAGCCFKTQLFVDEVLTREDQFSYRSYNYFYHPSVTRSTTILYNTANGVAQKTIELYEYDQMGNMVGHWPVTAEGNNKDLEHKIITAVDYTFNLPLTNTFKRDIMTAVRIENILSDDKKTIAKSFVFENDELVARTDYLYDGYGNLKKLKSYYSLVPLQYIETDYNYLDGTFLTNVSVCDVLDADGNNLGAISQGATHDLYGRILTTTDGNGNPTCYERDDAGRVKRLTHPDGNTKNLEYNVSLNRTTVTDELGRSTLYQYNPSGYLTEIYQIKSSGNAVLLQSNQYDAVNRLAGETVYTGHGYTMTEYNYDYADRVTGVVVTDHLNDILAREEMAHYADQTVKTVVGDTASPSVVTTEYRDKYGRVIKMGANWKGTELFTTYTHNYVGDVITEKDARANYKNSPEEYTMKYEYDYSGNLVRQEDILGNVSTAEYDMLGRVVSTTDAKSNAVGGIYCTKSIYDALGRIIRVETPFTATATSVQKYFYDGNGNITKEQQSSGLPEAEMASYSNREYIYNNRNMLEEIHSYDNGVLANVMVYEYDDAGQPVAMVTGSGTQRTEYDYDALGNLKTRTDPEGMVEYYENDYVGNLVAKTDRNGRITEYEYDGLFRELKRTVTVDGVDEVEARGYTLTGQLRYAENAAGRLDYAYDELGRLEKETVGNETKTYQYNALGLRERFTLSLNEKQQINSAYTYDKLGRLETVTGNGITARYTYDANGNRESLTYGNGVTVRYAYNRANLVTQVLNKKGSAVLSKYDYTYYLDGNQESKTDHMGKKTSYEYNGLGMLTDETERKSGALINAYSYEYDSTGNREKLTATGAKSYVTSYTYDLNNRLRTETRIEGNTTSITDYRYDPNGNQISAMCSALAPKETMPELNLTQTLDGATLYRYDGFNRQTSVQTNGMTASYTYLPNGLRHSKTVNGTMTEFVWDGNQTVLELVDGAVAAKYVRGLNLVASIVRNAGTYYLYNAHGDVTQLTDTRGAVTRGYNYDAFGNQLNANDVDANPWRYCGEYTDLETNTYYLRARNYNPTTGRFLSEDTHWNLGNMIYGDNPQKTNERKSNDPLGLNTYTLVPNINAIRQSGNLYAYCLNNPLMYQDPDGESIILTCIIIGVVAGAILGGSAGAYYSYKNFGAVKWQYVTGGAVVGGVIGGLVGWGAGAIISSFSVATAATSITAGGGAGFHTFQKLKDFLGSAGAGRAWHHIVEQCQIVKSGFSDLWVQNSNNVINISNQIHSKISAYYSSIPPEGFTNGLRFRDWLAGQSFEVQYEWGVKILRMFGVGV